MKVIFFFLKIIAIFSIVGFVVSKQAIHLLENTLQVDSF